MGTGMGNGICCKNREPIKNEDFAREIISEIKVTKLTYKEFKSKVYKIMGKKLITEKKLIQEDLAELFYEEDRIKNQYALVHQKFFEEVFYWLSQTVNLYEILFYSFPLLCKKKGEEHNNFSEILVNYLNGGMFSLTDLHINFLKLFELYTFKLTIIIQNQHLDTDIKISMNIINRHFFTFRKIDNEVSFFLKKFECENKEEKNISNEDFKLYLRDQGLFSVNKIRDYVLKEVKE